MEKNYYKLLGLPETANAEAIEQAIRTTRRRYRQLVGSPDPEKRINAEMVMSALSDAEETLLNVEFRRVYDQQLSESMAKADQQLVKSSAHVDIQGWLTSAKDYLESGSSESARTTLRYVFQAEPDNPEAWLIEYRALLDLNLIEEAIQALDQVIRHNPTHEGMRIKKVQLLYQVKSYDRALKYCRFVLERTAFLQVKDTVWWETVQANLTYLLGRKSEAISIYKSLIQSYPDNQNIKRSYVQDLLSNIYDNLSYDSVNYFIGNQKQYDLLKSEIDHIDQLGYIDLNKQPSYIYLKGLCDSGSKRTVSGCFGCASAFFSVPIILGLVMFIFGVDRSGLQVSVMYLAMAVPVLLALYFIASQPSWKQTAKQKRVAAMTTGLQ